MENAQKAYNRIKQQSRHIKVLEGISHLLDWDQETYMPAGAGQNRAEQLKTIAGLMHREKTSRKFRNALEKLIDIKTGTIKAKDLTSSESAALKEWRRDYLHAATLPAKFIEDFTKLTSQSIEVWKLAKQEDAFHRFAPFLEKIIGMCKKKADLVGYKEHPYDALIDEFEPNMTAKEISELFSTLRHSLTKLLKQVQGSSSIDDSFLFGNFDPQKQIEFSHLLLEAVGYDLTKGRLDLSSHPFSSSSHPTDSRITTRIHASSLTSNISTVLHEAGHSLYEMGLPVEEFGSPLGEARSLGVHESQSRFWETRIGLSKPFWRRYLPLLKEAFIGKIDNIPFEKFYKAINKVQPSFIRVEADEMTYPLHVILRFELEKSLIEGSLNVRDLPDAWNAKMKQYLGIEPKNNQQGCLQDIHWSMGGFGYFPTYSLGNIYAAHLFEGFSKDYPDWDIRVEKGEFSFIRAWLHDKIYRHGRRFSTQELLKQATGKELSSKPYLQYLESKYSEIYLF